MLASVPSEQPWFWEAASTVVAFLLALNVLLIVAVHGRRVRAMLRRGRERDVRPRMEQLIVELDPATRTRSAEWLRKQVEGLNELERPLAADLLLKRLAATTSAGERAVLLDALRECGVIALMMDSLRNRMPWRRALAAHMLGRCAAWDAVPELLVRLGDRNRRVRESAVRALGRIGDERALPALTDLYLTATRKVGLGLVYEALIGLGADRAAPVFVEGLRSTNARTRVAACYGIATLLEPTRARPLLVRALEDPVAAVRAAASETLGRVGGDELPEHLSRATRDDQRAVRRAAVTALASFDDPEAVTLAWTALHDPDRDTAVRAGETLVRLGRCRRAGTAARATLAAADEHWPLRRALTLAEVGAV